MTYAKPADRAGALRLHLNENTGGCSHAVVEAIRHITPEDVAIYPDYSSLSRECAEYLGVREHQLLLTNGLDEGLLASTVSCFRVMQGSLGLPEAIIPQPAFEMYQVFVRAAGGTVVPIAPGPDFAFPLREICGAITKRTRIIFLTSPNNPTGQLIPREALREIARCAPPERSARAILGPAATWRWPSPPEHPRLRRRRCSWSSSSASPRPTTSGAHWSTCSSPRSRPASGSPPGVWPAR